MLAINYTRDKTWVPNKSHTQDTTLYCSSKVIVFFFVVALKLSNKQSRLNKKKVS